MSIDKLRGETTRAASDAARKARDQIKRKRKGIEARNKRQENLSDRINQILQSQNEKLAEQGDLFGNITGAADNAAKAAAVLKGQIESGVPFSEDLVKSMEESAKNSDELGDALGEIVPGLMGAAKGAQTMALALKTALGPIGLVIAGATLIFKAVTGIATKTREFQRQTGLAADQALLLEARFKALELVNVDLEGENIRNAFNAARTELGATVDEAVDLSTTVARTAAQIGVSEDQFVKVLGKLESVSDLSREQLINQLKSNAELIRAEGLAPTDVFQDLAENSQLIAEFTKDGGDNLLQAAISARKLGLSVSQTAGIADNLLNFEESIAAQQEASLLLGRQLNLDKARQLAFQDDLSGLGDEILKQVGTEAEFTRLNRIEKQALARAVGLQVDELSKIVKNQSAAGLDNNSKNQLDALNTMNTKLDAIADNTGATSAPGFWKSVFPPK